MMDQKTFNRMWHKAYWFWAFIYTAVAGVVAALTLGSLYLIGKRDDFEDDIS